MKSDPQPVNLLLRLCKWLVLLGAFSTFLIFTFEAAARIIMPDKIAAWRLQPFGGQDIQFVSQRPFEHTPTYTRYTPNSTIRLVSYYPNDQKQVTKEYDCTFKSDDAGFLSNDAPYGEKEILLLGDSFTTGWGGCGWVSRLKPEVRSRVYSAAFHGTGPIIWRNIARDLATRKQPKKVLIVFITDDFSREKETYSKAQLDCLALAGDCTWQWFFPITEDMDSIAARRYAERRRSAGVKGYLRDYLSASRMLASILKRRIYRDQDLMQKTVHSISVLSKEYNAKLLWVNEKREVDGPAWDTRLVREELKKKGLDPVQCKIPLKGFFTRDNHPNKIGYEFLRLCVEDVVLSWKE